jgi:hypothetical protein
MAFLEVAGTVTRTFYNGKGAEVTETFKKRDGSEGKQRYALWFQEPHGLSEGDSGTWRGSISVEVDEWTDKENNIRHSAKISLNGARASKGGSAAPAAPSAVAESGGDVWNAPGSFNDETPF